MSDMRRKSVILVGFAIALLPLFLGYLYLSHRIDFLVLDTSATINKNDANVQGEMLRSHGAAVVTTREAGKSHSYMLFFAGDTDFTGDMGDVVDCGSWVAPHLPILLEAHSYPPCGNPVEHWSPVKRIPLIDKGKSMLSALPDLSTIRISR